MKKVLILDTEDGYSLNRKFKNQLAGVTITALGGVIGERKGECNPHGRMVGFLAGLPLTAKPGEYELGFYRLTDHNGIFGGEAVNDAIINIVNQWRPDYINCSWGMHDGDNDIVESIGAGVWAGFAQEFSNITRHMACVFFAAGNDDAPDADCDIAFPQRLFHESHIIGSCARSGIPSHFSGDGEELDCIMWGEDRPCCNNGEWVKASGTSFAAPAACGLCAYHEFDDDMWSAFMLANTTIPADWKRGRHSRKFGYGCLEHEYQKITADLAPTISIDQLSPSITSIFGYEIMQ